MITAMKLEDLVHFSLGQTEGGYGYPSVGCITGLLCPFYGNHHRDQPKPLEYKS